MLFYSLNIQLFFKLGPGEGVSVAALGQGKYRLFRNNYVVIKIEAEKTATVDYTCQIFGVF